MTPIVSIQHLCKSFDQLKALRSANLSVPEGSFFGLLGPNGAGKSTLINIMSTLTKKDSGSVLINGFDLDTKPDFLKSSLGIVPQEFNFNFFETCEQITTFQAGYYGIPYKTAIKRSHKLLDLLGLTSKRKVPAMRLSGGMKRRLMIARALMHQPKVLILDEPTAGVDIAIRKSMWALLRELNADGTTIILTTHYLEEAEALCDRLAFINQGQILKEGTTASLLADLPSETVSLVVNQTKTLPDNPAFGLKKKSPRSLVTYLNNNISLTTLVKYLDDYGISVQRVETAHSRLEELFMQVVNMEPSNND